MKSIAKTIGAIAMVTGLSLSAANAPAEGREGGNGGTVLMCRKANGKTTYELTDIYEARTRGITPALGAPNLDPKEKLRPILREFAKRSPIRAALYLSWLNS